MEKLLPSLKFSEIPPAEYGRELAQEIIGKVPRQIGGLVIAKTIISQEGWRSGYSDRFSKSSKLVSLLSPLLQGGFAIALNERLLPDEPEARLRREALLTAHEIAHTFFYNHQPGRAPYRITRGLSADAEEDFCEAFGEPFGEW